MLAESDGTCRFVWTADFLPDAFGGYLAAQMELGVTAMRQALERDGAV